MSKSKTIATCLAVLTLFSTGAAQSFGQNVSAQLSTREAYVGMPVVLQVVIENAEDFDMPEAPVIEGCTVQAAGAPSQSSQITIINGRRSESRRVTMQYLITPRREGTFEVPALRFRVDGRTQTTRPLAFVATRSETGDLLFVEIEGGKDTVYVGEPLDLKLKIWIKPYRDREQQITLSEGQMWQMISDQTSWGSFTDRIEGLAENNQRLGGREVLRDNGQGKQGGYYLYTLDATVYPTRPGQIDARDVQIVVNYPTAIGRSRDPFDDFFESRLGGDPFAGNSRLSQIMNDRGLPSMFGNRLTVSAARPIVAEANVDATEVLPIPTAGRPADYRGAIGKYRIVTQASPTSVNAGDPITLNIGIAGTGPMELVQAPPLAELSELTADFKVSDQPLAGFVRDDTKVFSTSVRPRREGITTLPAISFSFFDPETERFETVYSEPVSITVAAAEMLSLDAIVGRGERASGNQAGGGLVGEQQEPDFTNSSSETLLISQSPAAARSIVWMFLVFPPVAWLAVVVGRNRHRIVARLPKIRPAEARCRSAIAAATNGRELAVAMTQYVSQRSGRHCENSEAALGVLRLMGHHALANELESFLATCSRAGLAGESESTLADRKDAAVELLTQLASSIHSNKRRHVRRVVRHSARRATGQLNSSSRASALCLLVGGVMWVSNAGATDLSATEIENGLPAANSQRTVQLTEAQRQSVLRDADEAYVRAGELSATDTAESNEAFTTAAQKYQLLVDSGIRNSRLYTNLGNAYLRSGQTGRAIANYERARLLDPLDRQLAVNLAAAQSLVTGDDAAATPPKGIGVRSRWLQSVIAANDQVVAWLGRPAVLWLMAISSLAFWGLLIVRAAGVKIPVWRTAWVPLLVLVLTTSSLAIAKSTDEAESTAVVTVSNLSLHRGDGEQFAVLQSVDQAEGQRVAVLAERGGWTKIKTRGGQTGWVKGDAIEVIDESFVGG